MHLRGPARIYITSRNGRVVQAVRGVCETSEWRPVKVEMIALIPVSEYPGGACGAEIRPNRMI